jgi:hypothetical protein
MIPPAGGISMVLMVTRFPTARGKGRLLASSQNRVAPRKVQVVRPGSDHAGEPARADSPAQMQIIPVQPRKRNSNVPRSQGGRSGGRRGSSDA